MNNGELQDVYSWLREHRVINASGTMTSLGASSVADEVAEAVKFALPYFIDMAELQAYAGSWIARLTTAEAGCVTASAAAGVALSVAAALTGSDKGAIAALPDATGLDRRDVVIQKGHVVDFGASIGQMVRLAGARLCEVGTATHCGLFELEHALRARPAAAIYVISHHTVQSGLIGLGDFVAAAHRAQVPVIVDAASEYDLRVFIELGADLVVYSAHKFLGGPTAGIIAGRLELIEACRLHQSMGIGRPMKVGKESLVGVVAALSRWASLDHRRVHRAEYETVRKWVAGLSAIAGLSATEVADPTGNPITRVRVTVDAAVFGAPIQSLAQALRRETPPVVVRDHHVDLGYFELDPCNLLPGDDEAVLDAFRRMAARCSGGPRDETSLEASPETSPDALGPRHSAYAADGIPIVDRTRVPWAREAMRRAGDERSRR